MVPIETWPVVISRLLSNLERYACYSYCRSFVDKPLPLSKTKPASACGAS